MFCYVFLKTIQDWNLLFSTDPSKNDSVLFEKSFQTKIFQGMIFVESILFFRNYDKTGLVLSSVRYTTLFIILRNSSQNLLI